MSGSSPSVLLIRLDAVGDALALAPLLAAFRERAIPVDLVLTERNRDAFAPGAVRRVLVDPAGRQLREADYTHALVATEKPEGYRLARASGAPVRIGFENGWGKPLKTLWIRALMTSTVERSAGMDARAPHESAVLFELGRPLLGASASPSRDPARLRPLVLAREPAPDPRIAFQVTDKWERLGIAFDDVVACARALGDARFIASSSERPYADRFAAATGADVERFATLEPWKEAIAAARALVAPDSGALHVAGMTGTPAVAVFPPQTQLALQTARWHPWAAPYRIVEARDGWPSRLPAIATSLTRDG